LIQVAALAFGAAGLSDLSALSLRKYRRGLKPVDALTDDAHPLVQPCPAPDANWRRDMNLADLLPEGSLDALTQQLGITREDAERGAQALLPSLIGGINGKTAAPVEPAGLGRRSRRWVARGSSIMSSAPTPLTPALAINCWGACSARRT
jgi:hypothetical protein